MLDHQALFVASVVEGLVELTGDGRLFSQIHTFGSSAQIARQASAILTASIRDDHVNGDEQTRIARASGEQDVPPENIQMPTGSQ
jgi:hypothetical protein